MRRDYEESRTFQLTKTMRVYGHMIEIYKVITRESKIELLFIISNDNRNRGHAMTLLDNRVKTSKRKFFFYTQ